MAAVEPATNIIELRPKAVDKFREDIEALADILKSRGAEPTPELAIRFREVVSNVTVYPRLPGEEYRYEIKGWLTAIAGPELSAVLVVAEEGFEPPTQGL